MVNNKKEMINRAINHFEKNIKNYSWRVGEIEPNGVDKKIKESEVCKFLDFLDDELAKLKQVLEKEK